ncbi:MAG: 23S rRNA (pseudouridine(1915)-N(3))-methyltransferase RlmH [Clostridia bacterium]|nr:23S rRNA (pseudouridine(1915)-N(3))-methyltransferase RlmH [Clostridia bacterium]
MKIKIVSVGKLKDDFNRLGVLEYAKRLSRFCEVEIKETPEENFVKTPSNSEIAKILQKESVYIEKELVGKVIVMDIGGKNYSSEEFSKPP